MNPLSLRNFSILNRMRFMAAAAAVLVMIVGAAGLFNLRKVDAIGDAFVAGSHADAVNSISIGMALGDVRRYEKDMVISYESPELMASYKAKWLKALDTVRQRSLLMAGSDREEAIAAREIGRLVDIYQRTAEPVVKQIEAQAYDTAFIANKMLATAKVEIHEAEKRFHSLSQTIDRQAQRSLEASNAAVRQALWWFGGSVVLAMTLLVPMMLLNGRAITRPLADAQRLAGAIARGDLTLEVRNEGKDEAAKLLSSLAEMQRSLQGMVSQVRDSAASIKVSSSEVATGNADLSQRTDQTSSNLQRAASSIEQLAATVRNSAESATQANQLAAGSANVARRGSQVVAQVVSTMDDINASSRRIGDIIGVIDSIAFQTNILALNAAVEAARAGEQGRGFAVVASEVRSLAGRSAEAAREIKSLIAASADKVGAGARLVRDAGATMEEIEASVQRVSAMIGEITAAAGEQSTGIGEVSQTVSQLDRMTQQNSALVQQSAAASDSLKDQATRLDTAVAAFRIDPRVAA